MAVDVTFANSSYSIPEEQDVGWYDLTDYLVALSGAQAGTFDVKNVRINITGTDTLSASEDYALGVNYAGAGTVTLPEGVDGQIFVVFDASGNAASYNITIVCSSGQKINGLDEYKIASNWGAVQVVFSGTEWSVLNARTIVGEQNQTNLSVIDASVATDNTGVSVSNLQSSTFTFVGPACEVIISWDNDAMRCSMSRTSNTVDCIWDTANKFLPSDSGTGVVVTKSTGVVTVKNRLGISATFKIRATVGTITAATAWS